MADRPSLVPVFVGIKNPTVLQSDEPAKNRRGLPFRLYSLGHFYRSGGHTNSDSLTRKPYLRILQCERIAARPP
jgi:hypothetical protein